MGAIMLENRKHETNVKENTQNQQIMNHRCMKINSISSAGSHTGEAATQWSASAINWPFFPKNT